MSVSSIEWTDRVWNCVRGCTRVSEGCRNCYAETFSARNLPEMRSPTTGKPFAVRTPAGPRWTGAVELIPSKLDEPLRWRNPQRVFVNSMSDLFHESLPDEAIDNVFSVMALACHHTFQILTKRPERMLAYMARSVDGDGRPPRHRVGLEAMGLVLERLAKSARSKVGDGVRLRATPNNEGELVEWPLRNVWLGVSVEDQATANQRVPLLIETPAARRFISYEPALGPIDFADGPLDPGSTLGDWSMLDQIDWLIYGGESGLGARPQAVEWARSARDQCRESGTAFFCKQMGHWITGDHEGFDLHSWLLDNGSGWIPPIIGPRAFARPKNAVAFTLGGKGGDMEYWPADLRVREFPA